MKKPFCPTCKNEFSFFFGPMCYSNLPFNENYFYSICNCNNLIALQNQSTCQTTYRVPNCNRNIFLEEGFSSYFSLILPLRTFTSNRPSPEYHDRFASLKEKYHVKRRFPYVHEYTLYNLLNDLEAQYNFNQFDIEWMKAKKLYEIIASYYLQEFSKTGNLWDAIKSCASWRRAGYPQIGLQITQNIFSNLTDQKAALLTTRAAAFKDLGHIGIAENLAQLALFYGGGYYSENLLESIYYRYNHHCIKSIRGELFNKNVSHKLSSDEVVYLLLKLYFEEASINHNFANNMQGANYFIETISANFPTIVKIIS